MKRLKLFFIILQARLFRLLINGLSLLFTWSKSVPFCFFHKLLFSLHLLIRRSDIWSKLVGLKFCIWFILKLSNYFWIASPVWRWLFQIFLKVWTAFWNFIRSKWAWFWGAFLVLLVFFVFHRRWECLLNWALTHYTIQ